MVFHEHETFGGKIEDFKEGNRDDLKEMGIEEIAGLLDHTDQGSNVSQSTDDQQQQEDEDEAVDEGTLFKDDEIFQAPFHMPYNLAESILTDP